MLVQHCSFSRRRIGWTIEWGANLHWWNDGGSGKYRTQHPGCGSLPSSVHTALGVKVKETERRDGIGHRKKRSEGHHRGDWHERRGTPMDKITLRHLPANIRVEMHQTGAPRIEGFEEPVLPLQPMGRKFSVELQVPAGKGSAGFTVDLLPGITAAYIFTN